MNGLRISLQQYEDEHKSEQNPKGRGNEQTDRRANTLQQSPDEFERFKNEMKELGMWLEGDTYKKMTPAQQKAHKDKIKAIRLQKRTTQANAGQVTPSPTPTHTPAAAPALLLPLLLLYHHQLLLKWPASQLLQHQETSQQSSSAMA